MKKLLACLALVFASNYANAALIYAGQWQVDQGPSWSSMPDAYSAQQAAALLFGGDADDYAISSISADASDVNYMGWYSVIGLGGGHLFAEDYLSTNSSQAPGMYYSGDTYRFGDITEAASAFVEDNAQGSSYINYAFRIDATPTPVPAPASLTLLGLALVGFGLRRKVK